MLIISSERPILTKVFHFYLELFRKVFAGSRKQIKYLTKIWRECALSCVGLFATIRQALLSMGIPQQKYWSGLLCPPPMYLPHPGTEPESLIGRRVLYH